MNICGGPHWGSPRSTATPISSRCSQGLSLLLGIWVAISLKCGAHVALIEREQ